ncbi:hypothetical protein D3C80_1909290 [compost metagenome]
MAEGRLRLVVDQCHSQVQGEVGLQEMVVAQHHPGGIPLTELQVPVNQQQTRHIRPAYGRH